MPRMREDGQVKGEKEGSPGENAKGFGKSLRWEVSWRREGCGTSPKRECWKAEEPCPEKTEACSVNTKPCMKKTFSAVGCGRKVKKEERETLNKEAKEEESKRGKQRCREKGKGLKWFEVFSPDSEVESVGNSLSFSLCLFVVPPSLLVVTVPCSNVNVVCQVFFSLIPIVNLLSRRSFLSPEHAKQVWQGSVRQI